MTQQNLPAQSDEVRARELLFATVDMIETVTGDFYQDAGEPLWRIELDGYCVDFERAEAANNFALAINARIEAALATATKEG